MKKNKKQKSTKSPNKIKQKSRSEKNPQKNSLIFAGIIAAVSFLINIFLIPDSAELLFFKIKPYSFYLLNLLLAALIYYSLLTKKHSQNTAKYSFLLLLVLSVLFSFFKVSNNSLPDLINLHEQGSLFIRFLVLPIAILGIISLWQNRTNLKAVIDNSLTNETLKISLFSKAELPYTGAFMVILILSVFTLFYRLDNFDLYSDEAQVTQGAAGYYYTGEFYQYNFATKKLSTGRAYNRAQPHQWLMAQSYKLFGISNWSSRFPSAVFGLLLTALGYFISRFFVKDKLTALLIAFSFVFYFEFLLLERWARMYAILIPLYYITFYYGYRIVNEEMLLINKNLKRNHFISKYLNFNYALLPIFMIFLIINYYLHVNSLFILLSLYLYLLFSFIIYKEKRYLTALIIGVFILILSYLFVPNIKGISNYIHFFTGTYSNLYTHFFFAYPLGVYAGVIITVIALAVLILIDNRNAKKVYLYLLINVVGAWFLFAYVINYSVSFRYMSFMSPVAIMLIIAVFVLIIKALYRSFIKYILIGLLTLSVLIHFSYRYNDLYVQNFSSPAHPSIAWKTIVKNYKKGEIIYRHWGPSLYFQGIDTSATFLDIGSSKGKAFSEIYDTLKNHNGGWLTWHTFNTWRMDTKLVDYANLYFEKLHGQGIDNTNVEVFHYTDSMLVDTIRFQYERLIPYANLNLKNTYSIGFWINLDKTNLNPPILFLNNNKNIIYFNLEKDNTFKIAYQKKILSIPDFPTNKWHYLTFIQNSENKTLGIYLDGKQILSLSFIPEQMPIVKFKVNLKFKGQLDDIRIYNIALNPQEILFIMKNRNNINSENIWFNNKPLNTLYHWKKKL
ncbi:MAG: hypothetical protein L3J74_03795 [Bacteroidales bacterium]|nr:hypothetical protein [Bacteroidales bacterium]